MNLSPSEIETILFERHQLRMQLSRIEEEHSKELMKAKDDLRMAEKALVSANDHIDSHTAMKKRILEVMRNQIKLAKSSLIDRSARSAIFEFLEELLTAVKQPEGSDGHS